MPVYSMSDKLDSLYVGNQKLSKLYSGNDLIFSSAEEVLYSYKADQNDHKLSILNKNDLTSVVSVSVPGYPASFNMNMGTDHFSKLKVINDSFIVIPTAKYQTQTNNNARMLINLFDAKTLQLISSTEVNIVTILNSGGNSITVYINDWEVDDDGSLFAIIRGDFYNPIDEESAIYTALAKYTKSGNSYVYSVSIPSGKQLTTSELYYKYYRIYFLTNSYIAVGVGSTYIGYFSKSNLSSVGTYQSDSLTTLVRYIFSDSSKIIGFVINTFNSAIGWFSVIDKETNSVTRYPSSTVTGNSFLIGPIISYDEQTNIGYCLSNGTNISNQTLYKFTLTQSTVSFESIGLIESPGNNALGLMQSFDEKSGKIYLKSANFIKVIGDDGSQISSTSSNYIDTYGRVCFGKI